MRPAAGASFGHAYRRRKDRHFRYVIASAVRRGRRVLIIVHRVELVEQIAAALKLAGAGYGIIAPGHAEVAAPVQIASVAYLARKPRLDRWRRSFDFVVVDECHHAVSGSWASVLVSQSANPRRDRDA